MKTFIKSLIIVIVLSISAFSQYRNRPETISTVGESIIRPDGGSLLFGWFDPNKFTMRNSYSLSYTTSGGKGFSLGALTSTMAYQISNPLSLQFDVSLLHSPYNNLGGNFANNISGVYLTRAELNYRPSKNTLLQLQYRQLPAMYWYTNYDHLGFMPSFDRIEEEDSH
jgi:hypothetical protein